MNIDEFYKRCDGDLSIGIVGSVRSGKSSFIRRFMELKVLPNIVDYDKSKIIDDLPQSGKGKMIMTVEPKFVPSSPIDINIDSFNLSVRLVDSVGFVIPSATGYFTEDGPRMVKTPWFEEEIPFKEAAYLGTKKVISNHSTVGILMTSDGTIGDFTREDYETVEPELISELKELNKPFVIVLNSKTPNSQETLRIKNDLIKKYDASVEAINVLEMSNDDLDRILIASLNEFEIKELNISVPKWIDLLDDYNDIKKYFNDAIDDSTKNYTRFKDIYRIKEELEKYDKFKEVLLENVDPSSSSASIKIVEDDLVYDEVINKLLDGINTKEDYISYLIEASIMNKEFKKYKNAINEVNKTGYGVVMPDAYDLTLETPEIIKQSGRFGVKLKANGETIHLIKVNVDSTFEPILGSMDQSKLMVDNLTSDDEIWQMDMLGRNLRDVVIDGIKSKINMMPIKLKDSLKSTIERIVNEATGGMVAIIL